MASEESKSDTMVAVVASAAGSVDNFAVGTAAKPSAGEGQLLVKVHVTGLNPVDWKMAAYNFLVKSFPVVLGCDYAGVVEEIGAGVEGFAVGDVVFGFPELGAGGTFAEYVAVSADWTFKVPSNVSMEQAATTSVAFLTAGLQLFSKFGLGLEGTIAEPIEKGSQSILVWGGASTVGQALVQLASRAGYTVITTASKKNHAMLNIYGATHIVDYHDEDHMDRLRALATEHNLRFAADCVGAKTTAVCASLLQATPEKRGKVAVIAGAPEEAVANVDISQVLLAAAYGNEEMGACARKFAKEVVVPGLAASSLYPLRTQVLQGFEGVVDGLKRLANHTVSGTKLCARLFGFSATDAALRSSGLIPDLLPAGATDTFVAGAKVSAKFGDVEAALAGEQLKPSVVAAKPQLTVTGLDATKLYSVIIADPDAPSRNTPLFRSFMHGAQQNVPGDAADFLAAGDEALSYVGSGPPFNSGNHRYVYLVYEQPGRVDASVAGAKWAGRGAGQAHAFAQEQGLLGPVAMGFHLAQWEEFCDGVHESLGFMPPPHYRSPKQQAAASE